MPLVTLDLVLLLPPQQRMLAIDASHTLATILDRGRGAAFRLGQAHPALATEDRDLDVCEPHLSLFMMAARADEVPEIAAAVAAAARTVSAVTATATEYRHNNEGAPEIFFARSDEFRAVQRAVVDAAEPLRRGRVREFGPGGERLADVLAEDPPTDPARVRQLRRYGYDAVSDGIDPVSDDLDDRFNPHVTLTWPLDETSRIDLGAAPAADGFSAALTDIGVYAMGPNGTCTHRYGSWTLTGPRP